MLRNGVRVSSSCENTRVKGHCVNRVREPLPRTPGSSGAAKDGEDNLRQGSGGQSRAGRRRSEGTSRRASAEVDGRAAWRAGRVSSRCLGPDSCNQVRKVLVVRRSAVPDFRRAKTFNNIRHWQDGEEAPDCSRQSVVFAPAPDFISSTERPLVARAK